MHAAFLLIVSVVATESRGMLGVDRRSLLYTLISGEEVVEGPLDPTAYARTDGPGIGGARLAAIDVDSSLVTMAGEGGDILEEEFEASQIVGGNAVVAHPEPVVAEPGSDSRAKRRKIVTHTIQENETAASIADQYGISLNTVLWANNLSARDTLKIGDILTVLPTTGVLHVVKSGDTVEAIADQYGVRGKDIAQYNGLEDSSKLNLDQKLIIPDGAIAAPVAAPRILPPGSAVAEAGSAPASDAANTKGWLWPTTTHHLSQSFRFGHTGVDIDNRTRPPVYAAESGTVAFAGWLGGYGNLVIVDHGQGLTSYYGHLDKFYTSKGEAVAKGSAIAQMGSTGRSTGPHLHFEIRQNGSPKNPLAFF